MNRHYLKLIVFLYLLTVAVITVIPLGGISTSLSGTQVLSLRLDYLLHALVFIPLVPLWKLTWPHHPLWVIITAALLIAAAAELSQIWNPHRAYNINDLLGNVLGVVLSIPIYFLIIQKVLPPQKKQARPPE